MELNESKLIERELTFRSLRLSKEVLETRRSLVRWLALSLGVVNPGESRLSAISVLDSILYFQFSVKKDPDIRELTEYIEKNWGSINEKTLRYHLLQLKKSNLIASSGGHYYLSVPDGGEKYDSMTWINDYLDSAMLPIKDKIGMALKELRDR